MKSIRSILAALLALLAALVLAWVVFLREGGGCREVPDEDPEPACKPGDKECHAGQPAPTTPPPIGGAR